MDRRAKAAGHVTSSDSTGDMRRALNLVVHVAIGSQSTRNASELVAPRTGDSEFDAPRATDGIISARVRSCPPTQIDLGPYRQAGTRRGSVIRFVNFPWIRTAPAPGRSSLSSAASRVLASATGARPISGAMGDSLAGPTTAPGGRHAGASAGATHMVPRRTGTVGTRRPGRDRLNSRPSTCSRSPPRRRGEEAGMSDPTMTCEPQDMIAAKRPSTARRVVDLRR